MCASNFGREGGGRGNGVGGRRLGCGLTRRVELASEDVELLEDF